jgi:hypothetical protein
MISCGSGNHHAGLHSANLGASTLVSDNLSGGTGRKLFYHRPLLDREFPHMWVRTITVDLKRAH